MTNGRGYWKQFAEWAIALRHSVVFRARLRLTLWIFLSVVIIATAVNVASDFYVAREIESEVKAVFLSNGVISPPEQAVLDDISLREREVFTWDMLLQFGAIAFAAIVGFVLSQIPQNPVEELIEKQKRFIDDAAHELRTPISIIKTSTEVALMNRKNLTIKDAVDALKSNIEEVDRMSAVIKNIIDISRASDMSEMVFSKVDLATVVLRAEERLAAIASEKHIEIRNSHVEEAFVWGNATALEEMATNVMKNAVFYTPEGGSITVNIKHNNTSWRRAAERTLYLSIKDTGIGISKKDLPHVFDPFYRGHHGSKNEQGDESNHAGLGLAIVREIVKQHRGSIDLKSERGKGTLVTIQLPASLI